ncbi:MAG: hypothetical protein DIZ80_07665 [endosymbiont of Galathealinum brachiosum]|uniref:DUF4350 domain-containing protein n=1 Tax=endosymbiont of Galathealinum brachiosum TaxID=2200906 RepID=A0A370DGN9_9GAMM|nr:MAG: hypothetical protein DIZ80_07665 [endosymbiont of Galathealinum brachiosum]
MALTSNKNTSDTLLYVVLTLLVIGIAGWLYTKLEYRIVEEDKGYQGEAKTNAYLAAEFFLLRMGQKAEKIKLFSSKQTRLNINDTLLIPSVRLAFDTRRSEEMLEWVERGGHLIITGQPDTENESSRRDHILEKLGLYLERQSLNEDSTQDDEPVDIAISDEDDFWHIDFDDYLVVSSTSEFDSEIIWSIEDEDRVHAIQVKVGNGRLTLLSDMRIFRNEYIVEYDHAAFLFSLTNDQLFSGEAGIFYYSLYEDQMSLMQWLWENAKPLVLSLFALGVIVLWMLIPRFGPLINIHQPVRRQFLNHLTASGNYHWREGHYYQLISEVRKQLSLQVKLKYPEWSDLSKQSQVLHFTEISKLESASIEKALFDTEIETVNDFINKIKILEKLRKSL